MNRSRAATTAAASSGDALGATISSFGRRLIIDHSVPGHNRHLGHVRPVGSEAVGGVLRRGTLLVVLAGWLATSSAQAAVHPALFHAGAAARSIKPPVPVYSGGFSLSPPITRLHDPLQVRAFYVSNGRHAAAFVTIDAQGYFSGYQEGAGFGATADRTAAARAATKAGRVP